MNPTLTIIANAIRVAEHVKTRMGWRSEGLAGSEMRVARAETVAVGEEVAV